MTTQLTFQLYPTSKKKEHPKMFAPLLVQCQYAPNLTLSGNEQRIIVKCLNSPGLPITIKNLLRRPDVTQMLKVSGLTKAITLLIREEFPGW